MIYMVIRVLQLSSIISLLVATPSTAEDTNFRGLENAMKPSFTGDFQPRFSTPLGTNIAPYRKELMSSLADNWHPSEIAHPEPVLSLTINRDGNLVKVELYKSSGQRKRDNAALYAAATAKFPAFPESFPFEELTLKVDVAKLECPDRTQSE
ncbi:MAG: TonB C-terminal domain-containing protein [Candidatus Obscuribacterales bacterium]|nr:TonB C-terminal domain-containing protein [Candidatus Obscuribacterales bacterium]